MTNEETPSPPPAAASVGRAQLFLGFLKIGLMGFGGVAAVARHVIVIDRAWLSEKDYASLLGIGQVLPGPNVVNVSIMIGDRFRGPLGSICALAGLMSMPLVILIALAALYQQFSAVPEVQAGIAGTAAAAAGLVVGTALKMARKLKPTRMALLFGFIAFTAVGIIHLPMLPTVLVAAPISILAVLWERKRQ
ncbi:chromate transporter [Telmatospirillum siberiense]|uniref:Chromate transporter n=1 Tax=Telmatospirillum siberiense TaxID=382514 RepID=A0A2N3PMJ2_9PROT|nr:chromate transporter [Telmatospirillum siberiense]PKU21612.1 chromate transporter [Telmatospirillum siberiense]